ncbi:class I SAM-dependent methyltransferase [Frankia sp. CNm7]|uniref:Class I SAM-dependent methyltransferase n=1 Tax=Frankia nepalensis TaxID=1836974 RepID=A0A937RL42_9ACTN|nr:class I SAM-dependent methyltransferase [Frankia nepalensis]MBL7500515.1 class I SAM-dependent methyltransferase [Frankia nepalensis]MBL7509791.1 class I SAM-dependent methyltransferase [Frankia nepalensis]MBL7522193.1 class I SAM-dependent methyltransferase [Frankia nepalensis]MBL7627911.1 class I SAM-dependent methyltransferase [Frankia nepalensis]
MSAVVDSAAPETAQTNQHYDLDPRIFGLFLDPRRKYSSGYYREPGLTLAQAQTAKLHFVADRLGLRAGDRLLDVGCGWGALILFMAQEYSARVVGISPAGNQHAYIAGRAAELGVADRVSTVQGHFEHAALPDGPFDAVTMLGSIVHMPDLGHVMRRARSLLRRGGRYYVSESCFRNAAARDEFDRRSGTEFVRQSIFGWGDMRPLSDLVRAAEDAGFSVISVDDLTDDYRQTIDDWIVNVDANAESIDRIAPGMAATLRRYLEVANAGWGYTTKHYALVCQRSR